MTPTEEAITALEKALEAGPTQDWKAATEPNGHGNGWRAGPDAWLGVSAYSKETAAAAAFIAAANPLAIRTLLDAHAGALRDAERYRWIRSKVRGHRDYTATEYFHVPVPEPIANTTIFQGSVAQHFDAAIDAALATNTKGAAE